MNVFLVIAALFNFVAAAMHFMCIFVGAPLFRFLGAGEHIASMAEQGHWYAKFVAFAVGVALSIFGAYALSGAGAIQRLPFIKVALVSITCIFLVRAVAFPLLKPAFPENSLTFWLVTSSLCLAVGIALAVGTYQQWPELATH